MSITTIPVLNRASATFKSDLNTLFGSTIPTFTVELNTEIARLNTLGANSYSATSSTSLTIEIGDKSLTIQANKGFVKGQYVAITDASTTSNYMRGTVKTYNFNTGELVVTVDTLNGAGTKTDWSVGLIAVSDAAIQLYSVIELTTGTSWTCPAGVRKVKLTMSGGGGSGATSDASTNCGPDGAAGGVIIAAFDVIAGQNYPYTVGAGGAAVSSSYTNGIAGSSSTFTANTITYTATGGQGGSNGGGGAIGGEGSGTDAVVLPGGNGVFSFTTIGSTPSSGGGVNALGRSGGRGGPGTGSSSAGVNGKIILELYK